MIALNREHVAHFAASASGVLGSTPNQRNGRPNLLLEGLVAGQGGDVGKPHQRLDPAHGADRDR